MRKIFYTFYLAIYLLCQSLVQARGGIDTGGGDNYVLDFVMVANQNLYPWLQENGSKLKPPVDAEKFQGLICPNNISSTDKVFEACDGSNNGREVAACYNQKENHIYLSRAMYPISEKLTPSKLGLVAHEVFRKMGIEGDGYEVTRQMAIATVNGEGQSKAIAEIPNDYCGTAGNIYEFENQKLFSLCPKQFDNWTSRKSPNFCYVFELNPKFEAIVVKNIRDNRWYRRLPWSKNKSEICVRSSSSFLQGKLPTMAEPGSVELVYTSLCDPKNKH